MFLQVPENRHPLGYLVEMIPNWKTFSSIIFSKSTYEIILEYGNGKDGEESNRYYCGPTISFELKQITCDLWEVLWIEHKGIRHCFNNNPIGNSVYISSKLAA